MTAEGARVALDQRVAERDVDHSDQLLGGPRAPRVARARVRRACYQDRRTLYLLELSIFVFAERDVDHHEWLPRRACF